MSRWRALLFLIAVAAAVLGAQWLRYDGRALAGVEVLGADVGRQDRAEVEKAVWIAGRRVLAQPVVIRARQGLVTVRPAAVLRIDVQRTADAVLAAGRENPALQSLYLVDPVSSHEVAPVFRIRPKAMAALLARVQRFGRPARSATVALRGLEPIVNPSEPGLVVDRAGLVAAIEAHVAGSSVPIVASFRREAPQIVDAAARRAAIQARVALSAPVKLTYNGGEVGVLRPARLATLLRFLPHGSGYVTTFDAERLARAARAFVEPLRRRARNARFVVDGDSVSITPSRDGWDVEPEATRAAVTSAALGPGVRTAELEFATVTPERTTAEAQALGIRQRVSSFTTEMGVSSSNRIHNVQLMADFIDGTVVEPGQVFSFNDVVGPRTPERGFREGQMIVGTLVLPSIGGGVCQTATTLFNNAFELGLPIRERHNHSLYISHYPLGRDATVSWGGPDFAFRNDLEDALLIKASYTTSTLTFTFYGTLEGRRVTAETGPKVNWRSPRMTYAVDPNAPTGSARVVGGSNAAGFQVTVKRTVLDRRGKVMRRDSFLSTYSPQGPTTVYGPGRTPPGSYIVLPRDP